MDAKRIYAQALNGVPSDFTPVFYCPFCSKGYPTRELAEACSRTNEAPAFKPGDIVIIQIDYMWWDGLDHWMLPDKGHEFHGKPTHAAYFAVTSVDYGNRAQSLYDLHRARYSVKTLGIKNGDPTGLSGWNSPDTHYRMAPVDNPDARLIEESRRFIGEVYTRLL